ncbi:YoaK family protein [Kangiella japonica]|uniref:YoaK family protein n=1 Tax=Kangiella japonica TaxID=647384 RepID=A0ABN0SX82_9GAMM
MITKLPRWVEYGAFILALIAGLVNAIGFLGFKHQSVSHLSGTTTLLGTGIADFAWADVLHLTFIILCFVLGASVSGYTLRDGALKLGRNYSGLLMLEAALLIASVFFLMNDSLYGHFLASAACGLQNAFASTYSGAIVRTTHVTGIFTDLGIMLEGKLRGEPFDKRKALLFILIIVGFVLGGALGAYLFSILKFKALFIPAGICLLLAVSYSVYKTRLAS